MSTPCVIEFNGSVEEGKYNGTGADSYTVYVHHDGYPDHTIPLLKEFLKWNKSRNNDAGYTAANFVYWYKRRALKKARAMTREYKAEERDHKGFLLQVEQTGVGFFDTNHLREMDDRGIDYYYRVNLPTEGQFLAVLIQHYRLPMDKICNDPDQEVEVIV